MPLSQILIRLDGLYGNAAVLKDVLQSGMGVIVRGKDYGMLDLPVVQARLTRPPDQQTTHPESGMSRALFDCPDLPLTPEGPRVRLIVATHSTTSTKKPSIGVLRAGVVYELFLTTMPPHAFTSADVLDLYLHRGSFETVLSDEDREQDPDRWCSRTSCGQDFWQILNQWIWNLRLEFGQHLTPSPMRLTEFAQACVLTSAQASGLASGLAEACTSQPTQELVETCVSQPTQEPGEACASEQASELVPAQASEQASGLAEACTSQPTQELVEACVSQSTQEPGEACESPPILYGPPQFARRSWTSGFAGSDFSLQPDGTLRCPAGHPLSVQERRPERDGSLRVLYSARICHCRSCPLREQCQESVTTIKPRRVSAVFWPLSASTETLSQPTDVPPTVLEPPLPQPPPQLAPYPVLWGDWERSQIRRRWIRLLRTETVTLTEGSAKPEDEISHDEVLTRAQRAHWRLSWDQRLARNARPVTAHPLEITIHGLPAALAKSFGLNLTTAA